MNRFPPMMVNKAHVVGFEAGRTISVLNTPEGNFVEVVGNADRDEALTLPEGASLKKITLSEPWVVPLPTPTTAYFYLKPSIRSYQGPVELPHDPEAA